MSCRALEGWEIRELFRTTIDNNRNQILAEAISLPGRAGRDSTVRQTLQRVHSPVFSPCPATGFRVPPPDRRSHGAGPAAVRGNRCNRRTRGTCDSDYAWQPPGGRA